MNSHPYTSESNPGTNTLKEVRDLSSWPQTPKYFMFKPWSIDNKFTHISLLANRPANIWFTCWNTGPQIIQKLNILNINPQMLQTQILAHRHPKSSENSHLEQRAKDLRRKLRTYTLKNFKDLSPWTLTQTPQIPTWEYRLWKSSVTTQSVHTPPNTTQPKFGSQSSSVHSPQIQNTTFQTLQTQMLWHKAWKNSEDLVTEHRPQISQIQILITVPHKLRHLTLAHRTHIPHIQIRKHRP